MARNRSAGDLFFRVAFDKRIDANDGAGNIVSAWDEQFQCRAGFTHIRGGESVMADRLQGTRTQIVFVRRSMASREVTPEWRVRDVRTGEAYNIREVTATDDRLWLDFLCQSGVVQ